MWLATFSSFHLLILFSDSDICEKQLDSISLLGKGPAHKQIEVPVSIPDIYLKKWQRMFLLFCI